MGRGGSCLAAEGTARMIFLSAKKGVSEGGSGWVWLKQACVDDRQQNRAQARDAQAHTHTGTGRQTGRQADRQVQPSQDSQGQSAHRGGTGQSSFSASFFLTQAHSALPPAHPLSSSSLSGSGQLGQLGHSSALGTYRGSGSYHRCSLGVDHVCGVSSVDVGTASDRGDWRSHTLGQIRSAAAT